MYSTRNLYPVVGLGAAEEQTVWTGTVQLGFSPDELRFSTPGQNVHLIVPPDLYSGLRGVVGHCVRIEGPMTAGGLAVQGWALLSDATTFSQGGVTTQCGAFKEAVQQPNVEVDPNPPVTSGGDVTTAEPVTPGGSPSSAPPSVTTAGFADLFNGPLGLLVGAGLVLGMVKWRGT